MEIGVARYVATEAGERCEFAVTVGSGFGGVGLARTLNGVISVAQGTTVAFEPAGIGVHPFLPATPRATAPRSIRTRARSRRTSAGT